MWRWGVLIAVLHGAYAARFIALSSFDVEGVRYYCLFDDAMISMRHAANWAAGHGFTWNPGERVEGYTNFGWTVIMGLVHLLALSPQHACLVMQLLGIPILWGCLVGTVGLARACRLPPLAAIGAMLLMMTQWNLNFFTLNGMETGFLTMLTTFALRDCVASLQRRKGSVRTFVWCAAAMLVRPDAVIVTGVCSLALLLFGRFGRWRTVVGLLVVVVAVGTHALWRHAYYGEWLPNTYYLKATGWPLASRLRAGLVNAGWAAVALGLPALVALAGLVRFRLWQVVLLLPFFGAMAYQVYVGGDAWPKHYRFAVPLTAGLMVCVAYGVVWLASRAGSAMNRRSIGVVATAACLATCNIVFWDYWIQSRPPLGTAANRTSVRYAVAADRIADPEATVAVAWAGAFPYYSGRKCFDLFGKCDPHIARLPSSGKLNLGGHNKYDTEYTIATYKPDLVVDGVRIMHTGFFAMYRPIAVEIDGMEVMLSARRASHHVKRGRRVSWDEGRRIFLETPRE